MEEQNNKIDQLMVLLKCGLILVWYYIAQIIVTGAVALRLKNENLCIRYVEQNQNKLTIIMYLILFLGIWAFDQHKEVFVDFFKHFHFGATIKYILWAAGAYFICSIITGLLIPIFPDYEQISSTFSQRQYALSFISVVLLPPIVEEYIFRYKMQGNLKKVFPVSVTVIVQALLFGMLHAYMIQKIYATLMGIFFGFANEKEGSIRASIVMHIAINSIGWYMGCFAS